VIGEQSERIRLLLATAEVSTLGLQPIKEIDGWIGDELAPGQKDAYLTAGFFRVLGTKGTLDMLQRLERYDRKAADEHRKVIGNVLATAVGA
jgi:hypothetical protein